MNQICIFHVFVPSNNQFDPNFITNDSGPSSRKILPDVASRRRSVFFVDFFEINFLSVVVVDGICGHCDRIRLAKGDPRWCFVYVLSLFDRNDMWKWPGMREEKNGW